MTIMIINNIIMLKRKRSYYECTTLATNDLHTRGYVVMKDAFDIDDTVLNYFKKSVHDKSYTIFNHNFDNIKRVKNDYKRKQKSICMKNKSVFNFINDLKTNVISKISTYLHPRDWVILYSKSGCQRQSAHCDFEPSEDFIKCPNHLLPLACIFAIEDGSKIDVWDYSVGLSNGINRSDKIIKRRTLNLNKGDVVVFRGDLVHAGSQYDDDNIRLHVYLDSPIVHRVRNRTWVVREDGDEHIKKCIDET